ncbi:MAG: PDZ domain-containing protein [Bacteroidaceae bacterium]|nr:PDZ domain-containing protein [Bacteroidaceae bacterium]
MKKIVFSLLLLLPTCGLWSQNLSNTSQQLKIFNQLYKTLDLYYVDTLDAEKNIGTAINAMLEELDPYTEYYTAKSARDLNTMTTGKYAGIGALIHYNKAEDRCVIYQLYEGKPAHLGGLKVGDVLLEIDGKDTGLRGSRDLNDYTGSVSNALRGDPGTTARIKVKRPGCPDTLTINITRANVQMPAVPYSGMVAPEVGYIYLNSFTADCSQEVKQALRNVKEKGAKSVILDLRNNGGGLANEAVKIVNLFVEKGKLILKMKGKFSDANTSYATQSAPEDLTIPLVVLVNGNSASSSEIVCGSLQDLDRAVIVGERTFGKGLVQQPHEMPGDGVLKLTTSHYYIPSGRCIQALDYTHRTDNGEAYRMPDSLTNVFYTEAGRPVRDGGGITPDVTAPDSVPTLLAYVRNSDEYFDYINQFCLDHATIAPASEFALSDEDYKAFVDYIVQSGFTPEDRSKRVVDQLRKILKAEDASDEAMANLDALEQSIKPDIPKVLTQQQTLMSRFLASDICERYYLYAGALQNALLHDKQLDAAVQVLQNPSKYQNILK